MTTDRIGAHLSADFLDPDEPGVTIRIDDEGNVSVSLVEWLAFPDERFGRRLDPFALSEDEGFAAILAQILPVTMDVTLYAAESVCGVSPEEGPDGEDHGYLYVELTPSSAADDLPLDAPLDAALDRAYAMLGAWRNVTDPGTFGWEYAFDADAISDSSFIA